jgi:hypothetical protein
VEFAGNSTLGAATITNKNLYMVMTNTASGGTANIVNNRRFSIEGSASAGNATITNNFDLLFSGNSTGGAARLITGPGSFTDLREARPITAAFAAAPGQPFTVGGATPQRDSAVVGVSAAAPISDRASVFASYDGEVGGGTANHAARVGFRLTW